MEHGLATSTSKGQNSPPPKHVSLRLKLEAKKYGLVFDLVCDWLKMAPSNHKPGQILVDIAWPPSCIALSSTREKKLKQLF